MSQIFSPKEIKEVNDVSVNKDIGRRKCNIYESDDDDVSNANKEIDTKSAPQPTTNASNTRDSIATSNSKQATDGSSSSPVAPLSQSLAKLARDDPEYQEKVSKAASGFLSTVMHRSGWKVNTEIGSERQSSSLGGGKRHVCSICLSDSPIYNDDTSDVTSAAVAIATGVGGGGVTATTIGTSGNPSMIGGGGFGTSSAASLLSLAKKVSSSNCRENPLISPCLCADFRSHQHKRCIESWIEQTGATSCPFCLVRYDYTRRRKSFWSYIKDCELEQDFLVSIAAFALATYLFLVGLAICYHYLFTSYKCGSNSNYPPTIAADGTSSFATSSATVASPEGESTRYSSTTCCHTNDISTPLPPTSQRACGAHHHYHQQLIASSPSTWSDESRNKFDEALECHLIQRQYKTRTWLSMILFSFACTSNALLFIGIVSLGSKTVFRHYLRYTIWSKTNFRVDVRPYQLAPTSDNVDKLNSNAEDEDEDNDDIASATARMATDASSRSTTRTGDPDKRGNKRSQQWGKTTRNSSNNHRIS